MAVAISSHSLQWRPRSFLPFATSRHLDLHPLIMINYTSIFADLACVHPTLQTVSYLFGVSGFNFVVYLQKRQCYADGGASWHAWTSQTTYQNSLP